MVKQHTKIMIQQDWKSMSQNNQQLVKLLAEVKNRKTANPLAFYVPNGKQEEFGKLLQFVNVFSTGNGVGKSVAAINIIGNLIYGPQNKWFDMPRYRDFYRPSSGRIVSTIRNIEANIVPLLKEWFPKGTYTATKGGKTFLSKFECNTPGGVCQFDLMTYDTDPEQFAGPTLQWTWFDEPPPMRIFGECVGRLRRGGLIIITMTPLYSGGWIFDRMENPFEEKKEPWSLITAEIEDNCIDHGIRGVLKHKDIERVIAEYPEEEREARISGKPIHLTGRVFPQFEPAVHMIHKVPDGVQLQYYQVCDPHDRKPFAMGWYGVDSTGDIYILDEWPNESYHIMKSCSKTVQDYADIIKGKEKTFGEPYYIIDARYGNRKSVQTGDTIRDEFDEHGIHYSNSYTDDNASITAGHDKVKQLLRYDTKQPISSTNRPKLYVLDTCKNHIYGFLHYTYGNYKDPDKGGLEKVEEKYKDFMDCIRYMVSDNPQYNKEESQGYVPDSWNRENSNLTSYGE
jgi:phage terminase large subunit-like protein